MSQTPLEYVEVCHSLNSLVEAKINRYNYCALVVFTPAMCGIVRRVVGPNNVVWHALKGAIN